jgi:hypothetical protein
MSQILKFNPSGFTLAKYQETIQKLNEAGAGSPQGRTHHVCSGDTNAVTITDVWESMEDFEAFGKTLLPIMHSLGVDPGKPELQEVHNIIKG